MGCLDGRNEDQPFVDKVYIALPQLPRWRSCMPKVRGAKFGYPQVNAANNLGHTHHSYELYFHESLVNATVNKLKAEIEELKANAKLKELYEGYI